MLVRWSPPMFVARTWDSSNAALHDPYQSSSTVLKVDGFLQNGLGGNIANVQGLTNINVNQTWWNAWVSEALRHDIDELVWARRDNNKIRYFRKSISDRAKLDTGVSGASHNTYIYVP